MHLTAILSNPPTTSGIRTLNRVDLARRILGFESFSVANLFPLATYRTRELSQFGLTDTPWRMARENLFDSLGKTDAVLLAYGVEEPLGAARRYFRAQVNWLESEVNSRNLPLHRFGPRPLHPSRWQRHTNRVYPGIGFEEAARYVLLNPPGPYVGAESN